MSRNQIRIEFTSKTPFAGGVSFGNTGPYERLSRNGVLCYRSQ